MTSLPSLPNVKAAVLVPGFLSGADEFASMVEALKERGIPTVVVPMPFWHWFPCLGGRSIRPVLERIDYTIRYVCANVGTVDHESDNASLLSSIPPFEYSTIDFLRDMLENPGGMLRIGGTDKVDEFPHVDPRGTFRVPANDEYKGRVALIGHSAGGWISRIFLSGRPYGGRVYGGAKLVHSLVTLGTPNADGNGPAFENINWVNQEPHELTKHGVRSLAIGGVGFKGSDWGFLTRGAYEFCCPDGTDGTSYDGDGVTPIQSALALSGADHLQQTGVTHFPWGEVAGGNLVAPELFQDYKTGSRLWYGSDEALDEWIDWLKEVP